MRENSSSSNLVIFVYSLSVAIHNVTQDKLYCNIKEQGYLDQYSDELSAIISKMRCVIRRVITRWKMQNVLLNTSYWTVPVSWSRN